MRLHFKSKERRDKAREERVALPHAWDRTNCRACGSGPIPANLYLGKQGRVFLRPRLKSSGLSSRQLLHRVLDECHLAVTNGLEGLADRCGHRSRRAYAHQPLNSSFRRHINAAYRLVGSPGQNIHLFRYGKQFSARDFEDLRLKIRVGQRINRNSRYVSRCNGGDLAAPIAL